MRKENRTLKQILAKLLVFVLVCQMAVPVNLMAAPVEQDGFVIDTVSENGITKKIVTDYVGTSTDIVIPDGVTAIAAQAFSGCTTIRTVDLNDVEEIGDMAFYQCQSIESIDLKKVTKLGTGVFSYCLGLDELIFPRVESLSGEAAVLDAPVYVHPDFPITIQIYIPKELENFNLRLLDGAKGVIVEEGHPTYKSVDGALYAKESDELLWETMYKTESEEEVDKVEGVTMIAPNYTNTKTVNLYGFGFSKETEAVDIMCGESVLATVNPDAKNRWNAQVELPVTDETTSFVLYAKMGDMRSEEVTIVYQTDSNIVLPKVTDAFCHHYSWYSVNLEKGMSKTMTFTDAGAPVLQVEYTIEDDEQIEQIACVTDGAKSYPVKKVEETGKWVVQIPLNPDGTELPKCIKLECDLGKITYVPSMFEIPWIIDPSGYIYEAVPENRVEGAQMTIYYKASEDADDVTAVLWGAEPYYQSNPIMTDENGKYAWDVPEGWWQVEAKKDGYETTKSEWLKVPPAQTEVNLELVSTEAPMIAPMELSSDKMKVQFDKYVKVDTVTDRISLRFDDEDVAISSITAVNPATRGEDTVATTFEVVFENALDASKTYDASFADGIESYAGINMGAVAAIGLKVTGIVTGLEVQETMLLEKGKEYVYEVTVTADKNLEGRKISVTSSDESIVKATESVWTDANGKASIVVEGCGVGSVQLTFAVDDTTVSKTANATVFMDTAVMEEVQENSGVVIPEGGDITGGSEPGGENSDFVIETVNENGVSKRVLTAYLGSDDEVSIPEGVEVIGADVFENMALKELVLPTTLTAIEANAFTGASVENLTILGTLTDVASGGGVEVTGELIISKAASETNAQCIGRLVTEVDTITYMPEVEDMGFWPQVKSNSFKAEDGDYYTSIDGVLYSKNTDGTLNLVAYPRLKADTEFVLPDNVISIYVPKNNGWNDGLKKITTFTLNNDLKEIKNDYKDFKYLTKVIVPKDVIQISPQIWSAFAGCLEEVEVEEGNTAFKAVDGVLYSADGETLLCCPKEGKFTVPADVTAIGSYAFCTVPGFNPRKVVLPETIDVIEDYAFYHVKSTPDQIMEIVANGCNPNTIGEEAMHPYGVSVVEVNSDDRRMINYVQRREIGSYVIELKISFREEGDSEITLPEYTFSPNLSVKGKAHAGSDVEVMYDGTKLGEATADAYGNFSAEITLPDAVDGKSYELYSQITVEGESEPTKSEAKTITYLESNWRLNGISYTHGGTKGEIDMKTGLAGLVIYEPYYLTTFYFDMVEDSNVTPSHIVSKGVKYDLVKSEDGKWYVQLPTAVYPDQFELFVKKDKTEICVFVAELPWIIDPSGFVYEMDVNHKVKDAMVTIYYKESEAAEDTTAVKWDAQFYDQKNPLTTGADGCYAWNVPAGWWKVTAEKEGYADVSSAWMEVPPARYNVNLKLNPNTGATVENVQLSEDGVFVVFDKFVNSAIFDETTFVLTDKNGQAAELDVDNIELSEVSGTYARSCFIPAELSADAVYVLNISKDTVRVKGEESDLPMEADYTAENLKVASIVKDVDAQDIMAVMVNGKYALDVQLNVKGNAKDIGISCFDFDESVIEIIGVSKPDADGKVKVYLNAKNCGSTKLTLNVEKTTIFEEVLIEVAGSQEMLDSICEYNDAEASESVTVPDEIINPTEPEEPSDPTEPEDPKDPTEPEEPKDPTEPEDPKDPTEPENPSDPIEPEDPKDPTEPENPSDPTEPEDPKDPTEPENPSDPTEPEDPKDPTEPEDPSDPTEPEDPSEPSEPEDPSEPIVPSKPVEPSVSDNDVPKEPTVSENNVPADLAKAVVSGIVNKVYTGRALTQDVKVTVDGKTLAKEVDYTVAYKNNTEAGTAQAIITGKGSYTGTKTVTFTIEKAATILKAESTVYKKAYGAKAFTVKVTGATGAVTYSSSDTKVAKVNKNGKVSIKNTGRAVITASVAESKNYKAGKVEIVIEVSPKKASIKTLASKKAKQLTVTWKKDKKASGYEVSYSTSKKFKKSQTKTVLVKKTKTTKATLKNLKKGKTYYVKVRAYKEVKVNGKKVKIYSPSSKVLKKKVK